MTPTLSPTRVEQIRRAVDPARLIKTAIALIDVPSPTRSAGAAADQLASILHRDGFAVERPVADWAEAPAVVVRYDTGRAGRTLQFDGHLDTVHLPFVPPRYENGYLYGSGAADMKGGIAASVEAMRVLRDTQCMPAGGILLTTHDHHEGPWGDRRQVRALLQAGYKGDAVLLPEYLADRLPLAGRGAAIFEVRIRREGEPVHEVLRPPGLPDVLGSGAQLVVQLGEYQERIKERTRPYAGHDSVFVGRFQCGEIYNQAASECVVNGIRRWVMPGTAGEVEAEFNQFLQTLASQSGTQIEVHFEVQGDAFSIEPTDPIVAAFQSAHAAVVGAPLPLGDKPFVDDGNTIAPLAGIPALTHGPAASGAHTLNERVAVQELARVAQVYALTAVGYCGA